VIAVEGVVAVLVAACALATVLTRDPLRQAIVFALFGTTLALMFLVLQAPDLALSVMAVGLAYPMMILLTLGKVRDRGMYIVVHGPPRSTLTPDAEASVTPTPSASWLGPGCASSGPAGTTRPPTIPPNTVGSDVSRHRS
jgi:energy-converting hydrogenase B subunit D